MKKSLNILIVSSEIAPFSKTSVLADVNGAYPKILKDMGHDVRIITLQYKDVDVRKYVLRDVIRLRDIKVSVGDETLQTSVKTAFLPDSKVQVYFIDYQPFFFRDGIYRDIKSNQYYPDNDKRFLLFSRGALETLKKLQWQPDVIHCNEWQTGLIPFLLKHAYKEDSFFSRVYTLLTVRDFANTGSFDSKCISLFGMDDSSSDIVSSLTSNGQFSFLKAGIKYADCVNTTSRKYLDEIKNSSKYKDLLGLHKGSISNVSDRVDASVWNPESDPFIPVQYNTEELEKKYESRKVLIEESGLQIQDNIPVVLVPFSFIDSEGIEIFNKSLEKLLKLNVGVIALISRENESFDLFKKAAKTYKNGFGLLIDPDLKSEHIAFAGSDIVLLPSLSDSSGLASLYGLIYGSIPVGNDTGGIAENIIDYSSNKKDATGFIFKPFNMNAMIDAVKVALKTFRDKEVWTGLMRNGMTGDYSWKESIENYKQLYDDCITVHRD